MMQEDSNGESSFEFVNKRDDVTSNIDGQQPKIPSAPVPPAINLLSSVPPPSALPSFVMSPLPEVTKPETPPGSQTIPSTNLPVSSQPTQAQFPAPTFSAAIPHSAEGVADATCDVVLEEEGPGSSLLGWVRGAVGSGGILSRVAEKAKSSVDSMITTLDPQMREFIYSGGDMDILVASNKEIKISPIREAFQVVFGRATVTGQEAQSSMVAAQPVGFAAGMRAAEERIAAVRQSSPHIPNVMPVVAVENFLLQVSEEWFDLGVLLLDDPGRKICVHIFTQLTPVPSRVVERAQEDTPSDYSLRWSGLAVPIGKLMAEHLQVSRTEWHHAMTGVTRREMVLLAARSLAGLYKSAIEST